MIAEYFGLRAIDRINQKKGIMLYNINYMGRDHEMAQVAIKHHSKESDSPKRSSEALMTNFFDIIDPRKEEKQSWGLYKKESGLPNRKLIKNFVVIAYPRRYDLQLTDKELKKLLGCDDCWLLAGKIPNSKNYLIVKDEGPGKQGKVPRKLQIGCKIYVWPELDLVAAECAKRFGHTVIKDLELPLASTKEK